MLPVLCTKRRRLPELVFNLRVLFFGNILDPDVALHGRFVDVALQGLLLLSATISGGRVAGPLLLRLSLSSSRATRLL